MIEFSSVTKRYGPRVALDSVSFSAPAGAITAFCGPNGAGKSTALRVLSGIAPADEGTATVEGLPIGAHDRAGAALGVMLDPSAFHPGRSASETLRLGAFTIGVSSRRADECLDLVGLADVRRRRVGTFSLGMRQRLGIAHALLGSPSALVLDEPSNGLDPVGIAWLDGLLRAHAEGGGTVLVSTHHLPAVERSADRVVALSRGRVVATATMDDVRRSGRTRVDAGDRPALFRALDGGGIPWAVSGDAVVATADRALVGEVAALGGVALLRLEDDASTLSQFLDMVTQPEFVAGARSSTAGAAA